MRLTRNLILLAVLMAAFFMPVLASADKVTTKTADGYWTVDTDTGASTLSDTPPAAPTKLSGSYVIDPVTWRADPTVFLDVAPIQRPFGLKFDLRLVAVGSYDESADLLTAGLGLMAPSWQVARNVTVDYGVQLKFRQGEKPAVSILLGVTLLRF